MASSITRAGKVTNMDILEAVTSVRDELAALRTSATGDSSEFRQKLSQLEARVLKIEKKIGLSR